MKEKLIWYNTVAIFPPLVEADFDRQPERAEM
jgi:hypothetical protein